MGFTEEECSREGTASPVPRAKGPPGMSQGCLLYTSDAADEDSPV